MANHKSALKRIRSNKKKTLVRGSRVTFLRTSIKNVETAIENKDQTAAIEAFKSAESQIMKGILKLGHRGRINQFMQTTFKEDLSIYAS